MYMLSIYGIFVFNMYIDFCGLGDDGFYYDSGICFCSYSLFGV